MKTLSDVISRRPPVPWQDAEKIPWHEPAFSRRMLAEHLSQDHDAASRRSVLIDRHVAWIHERALEGRAGRVLDLGCGPGFYTSRLARLGHDCTGVDISPASIDFARRTAEAEGLSCDHRLADLRDGGFGEGFRLALLISGELNTFRRAQAEEVLRSALASLDPGGTLILEVHTEEEVRRIGQQPPIWYARSSGLFSDEPHLVLREARFDDSSRAAVERYHVIDERTAGVSVFASNLQTYSNQEYDRMLAEAGFGHVERAPSLEGRPTAGQEGLFVLLAHRSGT